MWIGLLITSLLLIAVTVAPHLPGKHWLIRIWEFPRLQIVLLMVLAWCGWWLQMGEHLGVALPMMMLLAAAGLYQLSWILPYTWIWPNQVKRARGADPDRAIRLLTSNVLMTNRNYHGLLRQIKAHAPDIVVTLESDDGWEDALSAIHTDYPHRVACPLDNLYGMHLYSRLPLIDPKLRFIIKDDIPSITARIEINGQSIALFFLHPEPPSPTEAETAKPRDRELARVAAEVAELDEPYIVAGDLNDVAWSPTTRDFRKVSGALDPRVGRGFYNTFHAKYPMLRWPLDHIFHSPHFELVRIERLDKYGSDHFPLLTALQLK